MNKRRFDGVHKVMWAGMIAAFLGVLFLSLFFVAIDTGMSGHQSDCPFKSHQETVCGMSVFDHLTAWKSSFTVTGPSSGMALLALAITMVVLTRAPNLLTRYRDIASTLPREVRERVYTFACRPLQELFSQGVLHPKLF